MSSALRTTAGESRRGYEPTWCSSRRRTGAISPTTSRVTSSRTSSRPGPCGANLAAMPTRKQRRRRAKDFRHDMRVFEVDAEGNEVPLAELRTPEEKKPKAEKQQVKTKSGRIMRAPPPPSWHRALRRGGAMGGLMLVAFTFILRSGPLPQRLAI